MSRIGKKPIEIPDSVDISINNNEVTVKGPKGELSQVVDQSIILEEEEGQLLVKRPTDSNHHKSLHGLSRSLIANMVEGVTNGFERHLEIVGVGYRAQMQGKNLVLNVGYSHPVTIEPPEGVEIEVPKNNQIIVKGTDKEVVGQVAARIRAVRKPEPYKGKGIKYAEEQIIRKVGKTGK
ncbi:50S ribosomal protein L6 [Natranaerobius thermophilus]|uniref:Large ribosomal subunit protein uL6 n=1 Tax=Natranaerobius thermophilus (strain ATCC BAA-1301 / DSM 18059 / JW/NM-WN-LF) TaxID=457570 RepID=RL6_NATTJ|nr:50S ribosomal protein L6 [Natranaerobius thermophilus]B2A4F4.1 RecName: Full=Large ribosomal subunit protein uL6; AltName: Full=50S ribosomal protein L6 [Natranaerobius thermophilus JW/NM-WN-LF]ACB83808.1 LSU ribosomal protein L6P [Natranaerobius thermophilus JW/NM-WN-LF]